jgi:hypothetical protein
MTNDRSSKLFPTDLLKKRLDLPGFFIQSRSQFLLPFFQQYLRVPLNGWGIGLIEVQIDNFNGITGDVNRRLHVVALIIEKTIRFRESAG